MSEEKIVYTVGHSNRSIEEFLAILKEYNIKIVVDVRRFPTSRKYPWFTKDKLIDTLKKNNVEYYWLGDLLGGYRDGGYERYMDSDEYRNGINRLTKIIDDRDDKVAILCSEKLWFRCHRRFISDTLVRIGYKVVHIIDINKTYTHKGITP